MSGDRNSKSLNEERANNYGLSKKLVGLVAEFESLLTAIGKFSRLYRIMLTSAM
jgi:hypothetical protein